MGARDVDCGGVRAAPSPCRNPFRATLAPTFSPHRERPSMATTPADSADIPSSRPDSAVASDRDRLIAADRDGKKLGTYLRLSGPGWLQSAITLGGGSLAGSLFLGTLGGTSLLWLQLVAIAMGVVMLSAISYVTLTTGRRPFDAIAREINPALAWGWLGATAMANMIWCMPQFSLAYDAIDRNLVPMATGSELGDTWLPKTIVTVLLLAAAAFVVSLNLRKGSAAKFFDITLKALIGLVVICFFGVVVLLSLRGEVSFGGVLAGFIPDLSLWFRPAGELRGLIDGLPADAAAYWADRVVGQQRDVMIASAATAVGINMTFLLPYSMLDRGWDKPFRGLARFDLATGMAIPYVLVTSCVVIAAATSFHGRADEALLSDDPGRIVQSPLYEPVAAMINARAGGDGADLMRLADAPEAERRVAAALVKRDAFQLSTTLSPLLGDGPSRLIFGMGVFGMGFSTIIILMLINGYVAREMVGDPDGVRPFAIGALVAGLAGASWIVLWRGGAKFWLPIITSSFGMMLLPIAYVTFALMMNSRRILGDERPTGTARLIWNVAMGVSVFGAVVAAAFAIYGQSQKSAGAAVAIGVIAVGFVATVAITALSRRASTAAT